MTIPSSVRRIRCANPSPMTLEGTNTYVVGGPESEHVVIVDPGPAEHPEHLDAVLKVIEDRPVTQILVTHRHRDHTGGVEAFIRATGAPARGFAAAQCLPGADGATPAPLLDGERIDVGGSALEVLHTPGHTSDSVCFLIHARTGQESRGSRESTESGDPQTGTAMLTGDTLLGRGTTMLDHPDGTLTDYMASLTRLTAYEDTQMLPAHGPSQASLAEVARVYIDHRNHRLDQVRALLSEHGPLKAEHLGELIYGTEAGLPPRITTKIAAAQLDHLEHLRQL